MHASQNSLNSNTTDQTPFQPRPAAGDRRAATAVRAARASRTHPQRPEASSGVPALEPIDVDTTPVPFTTLGLDARLLEGVRDLGLIDTRPIQTAVIPLALGGQRSDRLRRNRHRQDRGVRRADAAVAAHAPARPLESRDGGPALSRVEGPDPDQTPLKSRVLVLAPTRELAVQIEDEIHGLAYHTTVTSAAVYGGVEMGMQERALKAGVDIIVATPGRLMDHMRQQNADLSGIELLVLDEADRMMDMGFWPDVRRIITRDARRPSDAALLGDDAERSGARRAGDHARRQVRPGRSAQRAGEEHHAPGRSRSPPSQKVDWLIEHLRQPEGPVLIFSRTKIGADRLARTLAAAGVKCTALHADRSQDQRRIAVEGFKGGRYKVLVATDIAARGLDIDAIHTVINYEVPDSPDAYVHRVGRTGRADEVGQAITLVAPEERRALAFLAKAVGVRLE